MAEMIFSIFFKIINFLFPANCAMCSTSLFDTNEIRYGLCNDCKNDLVSEDHRDNIKNCAKCGRPLISEIDTCLSCRNDNNKPYDKLWVIYPYAGKYRELLTQYKFKKKLPLADFFADLINEIINNSELKNACIVPVPPRPGKIKEQGWDQIDYLAKKIKRPLCKCLKRRKSKIQKELNREERIKNLKGRIYSAGNIPETALLIDDVITTGSTIEVCSSVLKEAGAKKVYGICLFYD